MAKAKYSYNEKTKDWRTKVWDGTFNADGSKHRVNLRSTKSSADLERMVNELRQAVNDGEAVSYSSLSFQKYASQWLETSKAARELNTKKMYGTIVNNYFSPLSGVRIGDIRHSHLQMIINLNMDYPKTCKNIYSAFGQVVREAVHDHLLPRGAFDDIMSDIALPHYSAPEKRPLSDLEKEALHKAELDPRKRAFLDILYYLGLRRGEALALTRFDFDWVKKVVRVNKVIVFDKNRAVLKDYPKSDRGKREVPMPNVLISRIKEFVDTSDGGFLFHGRNAEMMTETAYRRMWSSIILQMNIALGYNPNAKKMKMPKLITDLTAHIFRHNYCTELCYQVPQISTKMIAKMLGDDEKMVLKVYSHIKYENEKIDTALEQAFGN